jgi:Na+-translocating ferredoxin:NAD+ oxidoreductase RnfE subunit
MLTFLVTNIAASSFAERCRVPAYILFSILMSGRVEFLIESFDSSFFFIKDLFIHFLHIGCGVLMGGLAQSLAHEYDVRVLYNILFYSLFNIGLWW